jgi:hypothetical protein
MGLFKSMKRTLERMDDRRLTPRIANPAVCAYFWNGAAPIPHRLGDISRTGAYLYTPERWYLGTIVQITLDTSRNETALNGPDSAASTVTVWSKIVRHGLDGVGMEFVLVKRSHREQFELLLTTVRSRSQEKNDA